MNKVTQLVAKTGLLGLLHHRRVEGPLLMDDLGVLFLLPKVVTPP